MSKCRFCKTEAVSQLRIQFLDGKQEGVIVDVCLKHRNGLAQTPNLENDEALI